MTNHITKNGLTGYGSVQGVVKNIQTTKRRKQENVAGALIDMKQSLKVGDMVMINKDLKAGDLNGLHVSSDMLKHRGRTFVITDVNDGKPAVKGDFYTLDTGDTTVWAWTAECFSIAPVDENSQHFGTCMECDIELSVKYMKAKGLRCPKCKKKRSSD